MTKDAFRTFLNQKYYKVEQQIEYGNWINVYFASFVIKFLKKYTFKMTPVYHPTDKLLKHSPVPGKTRNKNLVRKPLVPDCLSKNALCPEMHRSKKGLYHRGENFLIKVAFLILYVFWLTKLELESNSRLRAKSFP